MYVREAWRRGGGGDEDRVRDGDEIIVSERPSKGHKSYARGRVHTATHIYTNFRHVIL